MGPDEMIPPAAPRFEEYEEHGQLIMIPPWLQITRQSLTH